MIYLIVGYMWLFIHRPFEIWTWLGDLRVERIYMVVMLIFWIFLAKKQWTSNRVNWGVGLLAIAITLATLFSPYSGFGNEYIQNWYKILLFYIILMTSVNEERELKALIVSFVAIMGLFELHSLYEYLCGRGVYRMGIWRMIGVGTSLSDPNSFAASVNYGIPLLLPCLILVKQKWHRLALYGLFALAIVCIGLTGSRTGLAALACLLVGASIASPYRWKIFPILFFSVVLLWLNLPEELQNRYLTLVDPSFGPVNAEASANSREQFFLMALRIWKENPIVGIGPYGFSQASGTGMQSHSLYAELLSEVGLVGITAILVLIGSIARNFFKSRQMYRNTASCDTRFLFMVVVATGVAVLQLLFLGLGGHNLYRFNWLWYAAFSALAIKFLSLKQQQS